jgi:hypothetical protein
VCVLQGPSPFLIRAHTHLPHKLPFYAQGKQQRDLLATPSTAVRSGVLYWKEVCLRAHLSLVFYLFRFY